MAQQNITNTASTSIDTPASGQTALFFDAANNDKASAKDDLGAVRILESDVSASTNIDDNSIVRGDGGTKGIQGSGVLLDDSDNLTGVNSLNIDGTTGKILVVDADTLVVDATNDAVGIGTSTPDSSAKLDVVSTTQGARPTPSMTTEQRDLISSPATALKIYNTDRGVEEQYNGAVWMSPNVIQLKNTSGGTVSEGNPVVPDTTNDLSCDTTTVTFDNEVIGVIVDGGVNNAEVTVATDGIWNVLIEANETITSGDWLRTDGVAGQAIEAASASVSDFAIALETKTDTSPFFVKAKIGLTAEIF